MPKQFKYLILNRKHVKTHEKFLPYFIGATEEEAEKIYRAFSRTLNILSHNYAMSTGLEKLDLFEEALVGLARARRDFDPERSKDFKTYALYCIKDALSRYVRKFKSIVSVPKYLLDAKKYINKMEAGCTMCEELLERVAERASISVGELIGKVELIPSEIIDDANVVSEETDESIYASLVVKRLKERMKDDELQICNMIMEGETYEEIGKVFGKSAPWVVYKLKKLRERIIKGG